MSDLKPPKKSVELVDPGAHELDETTLSNSQPNPTSESDNSAQIPTLRVEKVDDEPSYGEVPGTAAYEMRTQDAEPDELEVIPESTNDHPTPDDSHPDKPLPSGLSIPKTVVEKVDPESPSYGEEPGTVPFDMRRADAAPDEVLTAPEITRMDLEGMPTSPINRYPDLEQELEGPEPSTISQSYHQTELAESSNDPDKLNEKLNDQTEWDENQQQATDTAGDGEVQMEVTSIQDIADGHNGDFGDDFDEFEEGAEDDDFGEFDEPSVYPESLTPSPNIPLPSLQSSQSVQLPNLNFGTFNSRDDIVAACQPYLAGILPGAGVPLNEEQAPLPEINTSFLTERSQSLWAQLVAPPPLQPPDWIRSRIRRLFLVSLGVPVDLDEILPASKQKKLVLPSMHVEGDRSPYRLSGTPVNGASSRTKDENSTAVSAESPALKLERKRTGPLPPPELDLQSTRYLCSTTDVALRNFSFDEMQDHLEQLEEVTIRAKEVLEYWKAQRDSAVGNQKAFEEVIENLVKHAQKIRK